MGQMEVEKGRFDAAQRHLEQARGLTTDPDNLSSIEGRLVHLAERRAAKAYRSAEDLELEGKIEEAIAAFRALDEMSPAYSDVRERIDRLEQRVLIPARAAYEEAIRLEKEGDVDGARAKLREVVFLSPLFADARQRLQRLEGGPATSRPR
jgi:tetratricopeptide (TPR) repeat protein